MFGWKDWVFGLKDQIFRILAGIDIHISQERSLVIRSDKILDMLDQTRLVYKMAIACCIRPNLLLCIVD